MIRLRDVSMMILPVAALLSASVRAQTADATPADPSLN